MLLKNKKCPNCNAYYDPTLEKCPVCHKHNELYLNREISNHVAFMHPLIQIGLFLAGFAYIGMLVASIFVALFFNKNTITDENLLDAILITGAYLVMFIGLSCLIVFTRRKYFFSKYTRGIDYIYGLAYAITLVLVSSILGNIISIFHQVSNNVNQDAAESFTVNYPILAFFIVGIIGPVCEELTYRVGLYSFLRRINKYLALAVTCIVFAFIHFNFE